MAARRTRLPPRQPTPIFNRVLESRQASVLDVLDRLLEKGVLADGDLTLGVAGVDLIYVRLAAIVCAAERVMPAHPMLARASGRRRKRKRR
jgi:hypothetical protein